MGSKGNEIDTVVVRAETGEPAASRSRICTRAPILRPSVVAALMRMRGEDIIRLIPRMAGRSLLVKPFTSRSGGTSEGGETR